jgi:hypothetical protein
MPLDPQSIISNEMTGSYSFDYKVPHKIIFYGSDNQPAVTLDFDADPPTVTLRPGMTVTEAAKMFWNKSAELMGQKPPFPTDP